MSKLIRRSLLSRVFHRSQPTRKSVRFGRGWEPLESRDCPAGGPVPFALPETIGSGLTGASSLTAADIDGDGDDDLLAGAYGANTVAWFENLGGTFGPQRTITTTAESVWFTKPVDLDTDGDLDALVGTYSGVLAWYENEGGDFGPANVLDTEIVGPYVHGADLNGDGVVDVVAAPDGGTEVYWFEGLGGGAFGPRQTAVSGLTNLAGIQLTTLDGNASIDLVVADLGDDELVSFLNNGTGSFGPPMAVASGDAPAIFGVGDLNGDGRPDPLLIEFSSGTVAWHANQVDGMIGPRQQLPITLDGPYAVAAGDLDGDGDLDVVAATYSSTPDIVWIENLGGGTFGPQRVISRAAGQVGMLALSDFDSDGDVDLFVHSFSAGKVLLFENKSGEFATQVVPPTPRLYAAGQNVDVVVHFGFPVTVTGSPSIPLNVGGTTVQAVYVAGSGTPGLTFRYTVQPTDADSDGIELGSPTIVLNAGSILDPDGNPVSLSLPGVDLSGVTVNGSAPFVASIERLDANPTAAGTVRFRVSFSESVTGVEVADFAAVYSGVEGVSVVGVTGTGAIRTVTVTTGTGSGTIGLSVPASATISDPLGNGLADGFDGGQVYTLHRRPERVIDTYFESGHGDIGIGYEAGAWDLHVHADDLGGEFAPDEILIYGAPEGLTTAPAGSQWAFLGAAAGSPVYVWPQSGSIPEVPDLGIGAEEIPGGTFAAYENTDSRVAATGAWVELRLVAARMPNGADFSVYQTDSFGVPVVWFATSDGIGAGDALWILEGSHQHFSFAFTLPGIYEIDVVASGFRDANGNGVFDAGIDPYTESGITTYYFAIDLPGGPQALTLPADGATKNPEPEPEPNPEPKPIGGPAGQQKLVVATGTPGTGEVVIHRADGTKSTVSPFPGFSGPIHTTSADMNGDGVPDIVAAAGVGGGPVVTVLDGATGNALRTFFAFDESFRGGVSVAAGDVTGDGVPDIIVGVGAGGGSHVKVFDGATGAEVRSFFAYGESFRNGVTVAVGDVNGDGIADIVTGTLSGSSHVKAFDGVTGAELLSFFAYGAGFSGGVWIAAGDLDGDGVAEIVTGAGAGGGSHVKVFRGGNEAGGFMAYGDDFIGGVRVGMWDPDGDGTGDIVTGPGAGGGPHVRIWSGQTLDELDGFMVGNPSSIGGVFVG